MLISAQRTKSWLSHVRSVACLVVAFGLVLCAGATAAPSRSAYPQRHPSSVLSPRQKRELLARHRRAEIRLLSVRAHTTQRVSGDPTPGTPFGRGDIIATSSAGVQEYSPSGQLIQTVAGSAGGSGACFNPNGTRLIVPGVGLFDRVGNLLPSNWAAVAGRCVADGFGNVYVDTTSGVSFSITKYDISGHPLHTFNITDTEAGELAFDVAPDECTIYYGSYDPGVTVISRLNACTDTQEPPFNSSSFVDDLKVLPNWSVLNGDDGGAYLFDPSGQSVLQDYFPANFFSDTPTTLALDPDGKSLWQCCQFGAPGTGLTPYIFRFDINTGQQLASWPLTARLAAVYGPPLVGDANVEANVDSSPSGTAETFLTPVRYSGELSRVHVYVDSSSAANQVVVGIYSNRLGRPGQLLSRGTITSVRPGSWNYVDVPPIPVTAGQFYWVGVLGPDGSGTAAFRDRSLGGLAMVSARHDLTDLPTRWQGGRFVPSGSLSAYGS